MRRAEKLCPLPRCVFPMLFANLPRHGRVGDLSLTRNARGDRRGRPESRARQTAEGSVSGWCWGAGPFTAARSRSQLNTGPEPWPTSGVRAAFAALANTTEEERQTGDH